jgi:hypothetical protein
MPSNHRPGYPAVLTPGIAASLPGSGDIVTSPLNPLIDNLTEVLPNRSFAYVMPDGQIKSFYSGWPVCVSKYVYLDLHLKGLVT